MPRLKWSPNALRDVERLHQFLASENRDAAQRAVRTIRDGVQTLARHPELGRRLEGTNLQIREWIIPFGKGAYVVLYHYDGREVVLLTVRHGREDDSLR